MSKRNIIEIDEEKCTGCGLCSNACAEGAIQIIGGKAKLVKDSYCDGLGACLGECPENALNIVERDAQDFDEEEVKKHIEQSHKEAKINQPIAQAHEAFVCPGSRMMNISGLEHVHNEVSAGSGPSSFELRQWPVQLTLLAPNAPYFQGADLLLVADCAPFCVPDFHNRFLKGKAVALGCPKLDNVQSYIDKMTQIATQSDIKSITILHIEVPCCNGLIHIAREAVKASGKNIPVTEVTIGIRGSISDATPVVI